MYTYAGGGGGWDRDFSLAANDNHSHLGGVLE